MTIDEEGCCCGAVPAPCGFCVSLTAEEMDAYLAGGIAAVRAMRDAAEEAPSESGREKAERIWQAVRIFSR